MDRNRERLDQESRRRVDAPGQRHEAAFRNDQLLCHASVAADTENHRVAAFADLGVATLAVVAVPTRGERLDGDRRSVVELPRDLVSGRAADRKAAVQNRHVGAADPAGPHLHTYAVAVGRGDVAKHDLSIFEPYCEHL